MKIIFSVLLLASLAIADPATDAWAQASDPELAAGPGAGKGTMLAPLELDPAFAGDGTTEIELTGFAQTSKGYLESNGDALIFGYSENPDPSNGEGIMLRLGDDGSQVRLTRFDAAAFGCSVPRNFLTALRLANGDYAAGGYVQSGCSGIPRFFNVLRLTPEGIRQAEFDTVPFNNQLAYIIGMAEQPDGRIVAVGFVSGSGSDPTTFDLAAARFLPDGALDMTFANSGTFTFDLENDQDYGQDVVIDAAGRILIAGFTTTAATGRDALVLALTQSGVPDPTFGNGGLFLYDRAGFNDSLAAMAINRRRIVLAGSTQADANTRDMTVMALTPDGSIDPAFGQDGLVHLDLGSTVGGLSDVTVGPGLRTFVTGSAEFGGTGLTSRDGVVAVLTYDGQLDPSFNGGQPKIFQFGDQPADLPTDVEINDVGNRVLVTGFTQPEDVAGRIFAAARFQGLEPEIFADSFEDQEL